MADGVKWTKPYEELPIGEFLLVDDAFYLSRYICKRIKSLPDFVMAKIIETIELSPVTFRGAPINRSLEGLTIGLCANDVVYLLSDYDVAMLTLKQLGEHEAI